MGSRNQGNFNAMVIVGSLGVLVVGSVLILWTKGFFSSSNDPRRDESRFTKFAEQADGQWEVEPPTELANSVQKRIQRDTEEYGDPRFGELQSMFDAAAGQHKRGEIDHMKYQRRLINLQKQVKMLEYEVDPELREKAAADGEFDN